MPSPADDELTPVAESGKWFGTLHPDLAVGVAYRLVPSPFFDSLGKGAFLNVAEEGAEQEASPLRRELDLVSRTERDPGETGRVSARSKRRSQSTCPGGDMQPHEMGPKQIEKKSVALGEVASNALE